jgi:hypothetical protein
MLPNSSLRRDAGGYTDRLVNFHRHLRRQLQNAVLSIYCHVVCVTIDGVWIGEWIDHLQVVTTNSYNTVAIPTIYISLRHTV